jgi:hypothetical protein
MLGNSDNSRNRGDIFIEYKHVVFTKPYCSASEWNNSGDLRFYQNSTGTTFRITLKETLLRKFAADNNIGEWPFKLPLYSTSRPGSPPPCPYKIIRYSNQIGARFIREFHLTELSLFWSSPSASRVNDSFLFIMSMSVIIYLYCGPWRITSMAILSK